MRKLLIMLAGAALVGLPFTAGKAYGGVIVDENLGLLNVTTAITEFETFGNTMDGMTVRAFFTDGSSETAVWADTGIVSGAAGGTGWELSESGDTFLGGTWVLSNLTGLGMTRLLLDGGPGGIVFDRTFGGLIGTDGSALGSDFTVTAGVAALDITATYRDHVAVTPDPPVNDIFRRLDIQFTSSGGFPSGTASLSFRADTDNIEPGGEIVEIPEPSTLAMVGLGALGFVGCRRRRGKTAA